MPHVGLVCQPNPSVLVYNMYRVGPSGLEFIGHTHGTDLLPDIYAEEATWPLLFPPPEPIEAPTAGRMPHCFEQGVDDTYVRFHYARAIDAGEFKYTDAQLQLNIRHANELIDRSSLRLGSLHADLVMECEDGQPKSNRVVLPTTLALTTFTTIINDLNALSIGSDPKVKHWIYFDDNPCACSGVSLFHNDWNPAAANYNNGNFNFPLYSVTYPENGINELRNLMHGLTHSMGAVNPSSILTNGAAGCRAGGDIMCAPGHPAPSYSYIPGKCAHLIIDCYGAMYFHPVSSTMPYWHLGREDHGYMFIDGTTVDALTCSDGVAAAPITCNYTGGTADTSDGIKYHISWGDGTTTTDPPSGWYTGAKSSAWDHIYTTPGAYTMTVKAQDTSGRWSGPVPWTITIT
jgi:hypothetical protein